MKAWGVWVSTVALLSLAATPVLSRAAGLPGKGVKLGIPKIVNIGCSATGEPEGEPTDRGWKRKALKYAPGLDRDAEVIHDDFVIEEEDVFRGDLVVHGDLEVYGTIRGDAVAFGNVLLGPESQVRGDVVSIGGEITREEGSEVRGDIVEVWEESRAKGAFFTSTIDVEHGCLKEDQKDLFPRKADARILFRYQNAEADEVYLVGDFNDWDETGDPMVRDGIIWELAVPLERGRYEYAFIVDGEWETDPSNPDRVRDREKDLSYSVIHVDSRGRVQEPKKRTIIRIEPHEWQIFDMTARYNRVDGFYLAGVFDFDNRGTYQPSARTRFGYAWGREDWLGELEVSQPLIGCDNGLSVGFNYHEDTYAHDFDEEIIGDVENTLAALLFKEDFRDYYERVGGSAFANVKAGDHVNLRVEYRKDDLASLSQSASWALFGEDKHFRCNPSLHEDIPYCSIARVPFCFTGESCEPLLQDLGKMESLWGLYTLDLRNDQSNPTRGLYLRLGGEKAGGDLGGDYTFTKYWADVRTYSKLAPNWYLDMRLMAGAAEDDLPLWKEYYVGGLGTLTARRFKEFRGNRVLLGSLEYRVGLGDLHGAFFVDSGDAWNEEERDHDIKTDVGLALMDADNDFRVSYAKRAEDLSDDGVWTFRINRTF